jgi:hypothetical protein
MSRIRADQILNGAGTGAPNFAQGLQVGAATTIHTTGIDLGSGNIQSHNLNSTGIITATSGLNVTAGNVGIASQNPVSPLDVNGTVSVKGRYVMSISDPDMLNVGGVTASSALGISTVRLFTNDNARLIISSGGQVTKPYNAAFRAEGNTQYPNQTSDIDLVYDNEIFDAGSNFDPSTGRFTAPVDGKYFLYFQYLTYPDTDPAYKTLQFKVNGTASYDNGFFRIKNSSQDSSAISALMNLSANDWVIPHVTFPTVGSYDFYMINGHAHFFGYLVS